MPYREKEIEKKYYSIGEVASILKVATSMIRFWESEFDVIRPKKNKKGNRQYTKADIEIIRTIYHLVKEKGYTLQGARDYLKSNKGTPSEKGKVVETLKNLRQFLSQLHDQLP